MVDCLAKGQAEGEENSKQGWQNYQVFGQSLECINNNNATESCRVEMKCGRG